MRLVDKDTYVLTREGFWSIVLEIALGAKTFTLQAVSHAKRYLVDTAPVVHWG